MKLTAIILFSACITASAKGYAQNVTLSGKDVPIEKMFKSIEAQTNYVFFYNYDLLKDAKPVTIDVKNENLQEALKQLFKDQPLDFVIKQQTVFITKKNLRPNDGSLATLNTPLLIDVHGKVVNEKGEPIAGASVKIKGNNVGTSTNENGEFTLTGVDANSVLIISGTNIESFEIKVNGKTDLATLNAKTKIVEGETVTINTGYQQLKPNEVTGSVVQIDNDLLNRKVSPDILSRLQGIASGLLFDKTNNNRNSTGISIRGISSIFANRQPLIVVDGFPYTGNIQSINPDDIESITILKDAAAASIWGAFSGNGVIVIVSKKGKYNQPVKLEFNTNITIGQKPDLFYDQQFLNSSDFINVETFLFGKGFYNSNLSNVTTRPPVTPVVEILAKRRAGMISASDSASQIDALRKLDIRNDYAKYFYRKSTNQDYSVNLSGGTNKSNYFLSFGYNKDLSNIIRNNGDRFSLNGITSFIPMKNLEITTGFIFTLSNSENNGLTSLATGGRFNNNTYPYAQLADANGTPLPIVKDFRQTFIQNLPVQGMLDWQYYPLNELSYSDNTSKAFDNRFNTGIKYKIVKGLDIDLKYEYQRTISQAKSLFSQDSYFTRNLINSYSIIQAGKVTGYNIPLGAILSNTTINNYSNGGRIQVNYLNSWDKHTINFISGFDVREVKSTGYNNTVYGYDTENGTFSTGINYNTNYTLYPSGSGRVPTLGNGPMFTTINRVRSYYANASYSFIKKYTFTASGRIDQSNLFGVKTNQKSAPLWSTGAKWDIDQEHFYKIKWLPVLKLSATYGYNGNFEPTLTAYTTASYSVGGINNIPIATIVMPGNPELRWEKIGMLDIGLDFASKKNIISGKIDYYSKRGIDMIGDATIPTSTGWSSVRGNFADMKGNGFDVIVNSQNINTKFKWGTTFFFSYNTDKVTKNEGNTLLIPGKSINSIRSYRWAGLDPVTGDPMGYLNSQISKNYNTIISAVQADPGLYIYKNITPRYFGTLANTFSWKGFSLSANIIYKLGYYFRRSTINYGNLVNSGIGHNDYTKRWQKPGDEAITTVPSFVYPVNSARDAFYTTSEITVEKGDHIRFQDINLNYTLNKSKWKKLPFSTMQVYLYANNLGILWKANDKGIDPDAQSGYPNPKTLSIGVRAGL